MNFGKNENVVFVVTAVDVKYLASARFNDNLIVTASVKHAGKTRLRFSQQVLSAENKLPLCQGEVDIACLDMEKQKPVAIPAIITQQLNTGE